MPTEQRIISSRGPVGARPAPGGAAPEAAAGDAAPDKKKRKKPILLALVVLLVLGGGAGWYFLMGPGSAETAGEEVVAEEPAPEPGEVMPIEAISLNLAGGRYLRLGIALQLNAEVAHAPDPAVALDHAISLYSGRTMDEVSSAEGREALRVELETRLTEAYHGDVMGVYYTDFVTQ